MFCITEELFIQKFIAGLTLRYVDSFPFDVQDFYNGIERMKLFFDDNRSAFGNLGDEIALLFIKNPFQGTYSRFMSALSERNGELISFENPKYEKCFVTLKMDDAKYLFENDLLDIDDSIFVGLLDEFCQNNNSICYSKP